MLLSLSLYVTPMNLSISPKRFITSVNTKTSFQFIFFIILSGPTCARSNLTLKMNERNSNNNKILDKICKKLTQRWRRKYGLNRCRFIIFSFIEKVAAIQRIFDSQCWRKSEFVSYRTVLELYYWIDQTKYIEKWWKCH